MYVYCVYPAMSKMSEKHFWLLSSQDMDFHKNTTIYSIGNPCPDITQAQKCGWVNQLMGFYFFFPPPKSEYFFQQHWESEYFFRRKP
jgi:hypothetical protein